MSDDKPKPHVIIMTFQAGGKVPEFEFSNCSALPLRRVETATRHLYRALRSEQIKARQGNQKDIEAAKLAAAKAKDAADKKQLASKKKDLTAAKEKKQKNANETMR